MELIMGLRAFDVTRADATIGPLHSASAAAALASRAAAAAAGATAAPCGHGGQGQHGLGACSEPGCLEDHEAHGAGAGAGADAGDDAMGCAHDAAIRTVVLRSAEPLDARRFTRWVASLVWDDGSGATGAAGAAPRAEVLRGKGVLCVLADEEEGAGAADAAGAAGAAGAGADASSAAASRCSPLRHIFQSVQEQFDLQPAQGEGARWALSELPAESRVVLIGRALDAAALAQGFSACAGGNRVPPLKSE
jgi:G3E family GTPase